MTAIGTHINRGDRAPARHQRAELDARAQPAGFTGPVTGWWGAGASWQSTSGLTPEPAPEATRRPGFDIRQPLPPQES